ncbi:ATP-binding protein [Anaerolineales bacterium HSG24]|nr:ATP-binding protein [Anaerolineales bacterium HSG24]
MKIAEITKNITESQSDGYRFASSRFQKRSIETLSSLHTSDDDDKPCPLCLDRGYLRRDLPVTHPDFGKPVLCDCRESDSKQFDALQNISNLDELGRFTFDTFRPEGFGLSDTYRQNLQRVYNVAYNFAQNPYGWLILHGGYGCGKTHLAVAIANYVISKDETAYFIVIPDLFDHLRATFSSHSPASYEERFEKIRSSPLLILDDLGTHSSTSWVEEKLFQLFNYRYNAQLPTVVTTNHKLEQLDPRVRSRMSERGFSQIQQISAPDFRQSGVDASYSHLSSLPLYKDKRFDTFFVDRTDLDGTQNNNLKRAMNLASDYAKCLQDWIVFSGPYGCGKTHLAAAIANEVSASREPALFVTVPDLLDYLRAAFSPNSLTPYDKRFEEVRTATLLVLDDLGTESATPWATEKLYQIFNYRYHASKPTVITMAKNANIHPRLKSMLLDQSICTTFAITATSYRGSPDNLIGKNKYSDYNITENRNYSNHNKRFSFSTRR